MHFDPSSVQKLGASYFSLDQPKEILKEFNLQDSHLSALNDFSWKYVTELSANCPNLQILYHFLPDQA